MNSSAPATSRWLPVMLSCLLCAHVHAQGPASAARQRFDVYEYQVEGNTVLGTEAIERAVYPFMGDGRDIDDVEAARGALEKTYHDAGFGTVVVDIPPQ